MSELEQLLALSIRAQKMGIKVRTSHDYPPIPVRFLDWSAVTEDYDCDCDERGYFSRDPIGRGSTEAEAVRDLLDQIDAARDIDPIAQSIETAAQALLKDLP